MKKQSCPVLQTMPELCLDKNIQSFVKKTQNYADETHKFFIETLNLTARLKTETDEEPISTRFFQSPRDLKTSFSNLKKKFSELNHSINLDNKNLTQFPIQYYSCMTQNVRIIDLRNNKLKKFPEEVVNFKNLETLKLDNNSIQCLPEHIFKELKLKSFSICNNYLKEIPGEMSNWASSLEYLNVASNFLSHLPKEIANLTNLKSLHINNNSFLNIPCEIHKLTNLKELGLDWFKYVVPGVQTVINSTINAKTFMLFFVSLREKKGEEFFSLKDFFTIFARKIAATSMRGLGNNNNMNNLLKPLNKMIFEAVLNEDLGIIRYLIAENSGLNKILNEMGHSPLSFAINEEKYLSAKLLIQSSADVNIGGGEYGCPLNLGVTKLQIYLIKDLLKYGASPNLTNNRGNYSLNFLFDEWNIESDSLAYKIFHLLMETETQANIRNEEGETPLQRAITKRLKIPVRNIVEYNARNDGKNLFDFKKKTRRKKETCLHLAAFTEDPEMIQLVLDQEDTLDQLFEYDVDGMRPIHLAKKSYSCVKMLRKYDRILLKGFMPPKLKSKRTILTADNQDNSNENIGLDDEAESINHNLTMKMKHINGLNVKNNCFKAKIFAKTLAKSPVRIMFKENLNIEDSNDSIKTDFDEDFTEDQTSNTTKRFAVKQLPLSPNNIKKIERIQKYSNYFSKSQSERLMLSSARKLGLEEKKGIGSKVFLANIYKTVTYKFEKYNKKLLDMHLQVVSGKNLLSHRIYCLFRMFKIHHKMIKLAKDLIEKKISLAIVNANLFESSQIDEEILKKGQKQGESMQSFMIVFGELARILQEIEGDLSYENRNIRYQIMTFSSFFRGNLFDEKLNEKEEEIVKYERAQGLNRRFQSG